MKSASACSRAAWRRSPWIAPALHALALELLDEPVGAALGAHEHQRAVVAAGDRRGDLHLVHLVDEQEAVVHLVDGELVGDRPRGATGSCMVAVDQALDRAVERRREQHRLVLRRRCA